MQVIVDEERAFALIDILLARLRSKKDPFNRPEAIIPQELIPADIRKSKQTLACFYFYACIYMRGGIESSQAFMALARMWQDDSTLFDPLLARWVTHEHMQNVLKSYIGWDSKSAALSWIENSRRLCLYWDGNPLNLLKGLTSYDEALRRMRNKLTIREQKDAGPNGKGFRGFQPKMVSMLVYFFDWEGWLTKPFLYPAPADFHNFRLAFATGAMHVEPARAFVRSSEEISAPWRDVVMKYLVSRKARPKEVADALWLYSLVLCGNSPLTVTLEERTNGSGMFALSDLPHEQGRRVASQASFAQLSRTCLRCSISHLCTLAVPSKPYYRAGKLMLNERPRVENWLLTTSPDSFFYAMKEEDQATLF